MSNNDKIFRAAIYARLSREDGDSFFAGKNESDSITNQKLLIQNHLAKMPDIEVVKVFEDDGYTGTNFERPAFQKLIKAIKEGDIDCVVVKDFSRLGREYLEAGNYIEKIFPALGVRFISINDDYDSLRPKGQTDNLVVPFKNLLNEQYCRDTSNKIRSSLKVKRQSGLFVSNFAVYGYKRDPANKNYLVVDDYAAQIVRDIFKMKFDGYSMLAIAERLSEQKILTPADYKKESGTKYTTSFKTTVHSKWSAVAIRRILMNEVYCGCLVQGKRNKKSYKVNIQENVDEENWDRVEGTHEAIISKVLFDEVQRLLQDDTRVGKDRDTVHPLAGKVFCNDCGGAMVRKIVPCNKKKYVYYVCGNNKQNKEWCAAHHIPVEKLEKAVLASIQVQLELVLNMEKAMDKMDHLVWEQREIQKMKVQDDVLEAEIEQNQSLRLSVYEDLKSGLIDKSEYEGLRRVFADRIEELKKSREKLKTEQNAIMQGLNSQQEFLSEFRKHSQIEVLNRNLVIALIDYVKVIDSKNVVVEFRYKDRFSSMLRFMEDDCRHKVTVSLDGEVNDHGKSK